MKGTTDLPHAASGLPSEPGRRLGTSMEGLPLQADELMKIKATHVEEEAEEERAEVSLDHISRPTSIDRSALPTLVFYFIYCSDTTYLTGDPTTYPGMRVNFTPLPPSHLLLRAFTSTCRTQVASFLMAVSALRRIRSASTIRTSPSCRYVYLLLVLPACYTK